MGSCAVKSKVIDSASGMGNSAFGVGGDPSCYPPNNCNNWSFNNNHHHAIIINPDPSAPPASPPPTTQSSWPIQYSENSQQVSGTQNKNTC